MRIARSTAAAVLLAAGFAVAPTALSPAAAQTACASSRLAGEDDAATAAAVSAEVHDEADHVVIARSDEYADALAAIPLTRALDAALLFVDRDALPTTTADEIVRLGATRATILGGDAAVSPDVAAELEAQGLLVDRVGGRTRFETAVLAAERVDVDPEEFVVVEGTDPNPARGWPDAVGSSAYAAAVGAPILLVATDEVPDATATVLAQHPTARVTVVGGTASVAHRTLLALADPAGDGVWDRTVERVSGADRYVTATEVAWQQTARTTPPERLWLASGRSFAAALAAGAGAAATNGHLLLVQGTTPLVDEPAATFRRDLPAAPDSIAVVGGTDAVTPAVLADVGAWLCDGPVPTPPLGEDGYRCATGGLANHRRVSPSASLSAAWAAAGDTPTAEQARAVMRAAGPFTAFFDTNATLRAEFDGWIDRSPSIAFAYHETTHHWQFTGAPSGGGFRSCLALDHQQRGVFGHPLDAGAPEPSAIAETLRARADRDLPAGSFQRSALDSIIDLYLVCEPGEQVCPSAHENVAVLLAEFHAYVLGYELHEAAVDGAAPAGARITIDGGWGIVPGTALYLRHLRTTAPAAWQQFVDRNAGTLTELWRLWERNYPGPRSSFGVDDARALWDFAFADDLAGEIRLATSARAGTATPPRP